MSDFEKFKEEFPSKGKVSDKEYEHVLNIWNKFEMKTLKDYNDLYIKYDTSF